MSLHVSQVGPALRRTYRIAAMGILALSATAALTYFANRDDDSAVAAAFERSRLGREVQTLILERAEQLRSASLLPDELRERDAQLRRRVSATLDSLQLDALAEEGSVIRDAREDYTAWDVVVTKALEPAIAELGQLARGDQFLYRIESRLDEFQRIQDSAFGRALTREQWLRKTRIGCWIVELVLIFAGLLVAHRTVLRQVSAAIESQYEILDRLASASEYRDDETGQHTQRVGELAARIAHAMGLDDERAETIRRAAALHDVGKIGIPDNILLKPGRLTSAELDVMRQHTVIGARILEGGHSPVVVVAARIARSHHERWDGTGYPDRLVAEQIPIEARITAVADVFDAIRSKRAYRDAWALEMSLDEIRRQAGTQFDPKVVDAFFGGQCYEGYAVAGGQSQDGGSRPPPIQRNRASTEECEADSSGSRRLADGVEIALKVAS